MNDTQALGKKIIALVGFNEQLDEIFNSCDFHNRELMHFSNGMKMVSAWLGDNLDIVAVVSFSEIMAPGGLSFLEAIKKKQRPEIPFLLIVNHFDSNLRALALEAGITDVFRLPVKANSIEKRLNFLIENWGMLKTNSKSDKLAVKNIEFTKRLFDVVFSSMALLLLSPIFLITYILIRLESKGPAFYYSLRVGIGYRVFKFYKFRSMYVNSDKRLKDLKHTNQYNIDAEPLLKNEALNNAFCAECKAGGRCHYPLFMDNTQLCEKDFREAKKNDASSAFIKIKKLPHITKVGSFIRNTSIDELPLLWNVLIGDMSIVGNRPLPLHEAEKLTTDKHILRFAAPAGITGLWQVKKLGKVGMSEDERLMLDNIYAQSHSFKNDIKLIFKTIPLLLQKEKV